MGAMIGFVFSGGKGENVGISSGIATSAHKYNYLSHLESEELEAMELQCEQQNEAACERAGELLALDAQRDKELIEELKSACGESEAACLEYGNKVRNLAEEHGWALNGVEGVSELPMSDINHSRSNEEYKFILSLLESAELSNEYIYHHERFVENIKTQARVAGITGAAIDGIIVGITTAACPESGISCVAAAVAVDSLVSNVKQAATGEVTDPLLLQGLQYVADDEQAAAWLYLGITVGLDAGAAVSFAKQLAKSNINPYNLLPGRGGDVGELFSKRPTSFDPMDALQLERVKEAFARQGKIIDSSEDALKYLESKGAEGVTFNADTILIRPDASPSVVFEELIHTAQFRTGRYDTWVSQYGNAGATMKPEYEAANRLVKNQKAYGISNNEHNINLARVKEFGGQLDNMGIPRD